jgi:VTC domain
MRLITTRDRHVGNAELGEHIGGFDAISLPELEERAELQMRVDRKYIVEHDTLSRLFDQVGADYVALEIDGERLQHYDSIYFDTPGLMGYRHHLQGRRRRFKCRTRLYGGETCFFDLKLKGRRGETVKHRLPLSALDHGSLGPRATSFLNQKLLEEYGCRAPDDLVPMLHTSFSRLTLVHATRPERLTFDFGIRAGIARDEERYRIRPNRVLIETKSAAQLGVVDRLLPGLGARPLSMCSKYCLGVALTNPALPTNLYKPLLRRHFDQTPLPVEGAGLELAEGA